MQHRGSLHGVIDLHVHTAPDVIPRRQTDLQLARTAKGAGMRALVLKNHTLPTADRALVVRETVPGIAVYGGIVLNHPSGGINPAAVEVTLALGGRIIWMPTVSASNHLEYLRRETGERHVRAITPDLGAGLRILDAQGSLTPATRYIVRLVAEAGAVLATGHLSVEESCAVVEYGRREGVRRLLITHPEAPQIDMAIEIQRRLAASGAVFERCYYSLLAGTTTAAELVADIRAVGADSTILATDLGQTHNPPVVEGWTRFEAAMKSAGLTDAEWDLVARRNPARLLGLDVDDADT